MLFRTLGTLITVSSLVANFAYATKQTFSGKELYLAYVSVLCLRFIYAILLIVKNLCNHVCSKENNSLRANLYIDRNDQARVKHQQSEHTKLGYILYTVLPMTYFTGSYRLMNFKNFPTVIGSGLIYDFFLNALPLLFIMAINNATLAQ